MALTVKGSSSNFEMSLEMDGDMPTVYVTTPSGRKIEIGYFHEGGFEKQYVDDSEVDMLDGVLAFDCNEIAVQ